MQHDPSFSLHRSSRLISRRSQEAPQIRGDFIRNCCNEYCQVSEPSDNRFLTAEELRKVRQKRPEIRALYRLEAGRGDPYKTALRNLEIINRMITLI